MEYGLKVIAFYVQKAYNTLHSCHNFPAGSRQAARGARICETNFQPNQVCQLVAIAETTILLLLHPCQVTAREPLLTLLLDKMAAILADDLFKCIFLNKNDRFLLWISLTFVPRSPIDNKPALVEVMAWRRTGDKPLPQPMLTQFTD